MELPESYRERMKRLLQDEAELYFAALDREPVRALRFLPERGSEAFFESGFSLQPVLFLPNAYLFSGEGIGFSPFHRSGAVYVQEPGAMAPVAGVEILPDFKILDLCAAPGGKAFQAASFLGEDGVLIANEVVPERCRVLNQNAERLGVKNCAVTNLSPAHLAAFYGAAFDLVICDAPCSGEGMMRKNPNAVKEWSEENIRFCAARQAEILESAARLTAPGGFLLYATCTFAPEENEDQIVRFLSLHPEFKLVPVKKEIQNATENGLPRKGAETRLCRRCYPHKMPAEGQFFALMQKKDGERRRFKEKETEKKDPGIALARRFLEENLSLVPEGVFRREKDGIYLAPRFPLPEKGVFSPGVKLGSEEKNRFEPHHRLFMTYPSLFRNKISLFRDRDGEILETYLRGGEIPAPFAGWGVVLWENGPLGGVKASGGIAKNHLPKGLRNRV